MHSIIFSYKIVKNSSPCKCFLVINEKKGTTKFLSFLSTNFTKNFLQPCNYFLYLKLYNFKVNYQFNILYYNTETEAFKLTCLKSVNYGSI